MLSHPTVAGPSSRPRAGLVWALLTMEKCSVTASYSVGAYPDRRGQLPNAYPDRRTGRASQPGCGSRVWCTTARRPGVKPREKNREFRVFLLRVPKALASDGFWTILASTRRACLGPGRDGKVFCDNKLQRWSLPRSAWITPERLPRSAYSAPRIGQCLDGESLPPSEGLLAGKRWPRMPAMHRRLVNCRLVDHNTFRIEASDGDSGPSRLVVPESLILGHRETSLLAFPYRSHLDLHGLLTAEAHP